MTDEHERIKDGIGVPNILVNTVQPQKSLFSEILEANILPDVASVRIHKLFLLEFKFDLKIYCLSKAIF